MITFVVSCSPLLRGESTYQVPHTPSAPLSVPSDAPSGLHNRTVRIHTGCTHTNLRPPSTLSAFAESLARRGPTMRRWRCFRDPLPPSPAHGTSVPTGAIVSTGSYGACSSYLPSRVYGLFESPYGLVLRLPAHHSSVTGGPKISVFPNKEGIDGDSWRRGRGWLGGVPISRGQVNWCWRRLDKGNSLYPRIIRILHPFLAPLIWQIYSGQLRDVAARSSRQLSQCRFVSRCVFFCFCFVFRQSDPLARSADVCRFDDLDSRYLRYLWR